MALADTLPPGSMSGGGTPRVAFFHSYWTVGDQIQLGGSDYWRLALPAAELYRNGWDVILARCVRVGPDGTLEVMDPTGQWYDDRDIIVWGQWMSEGTAAHLLRARAMGQVIINDIDDDYWSIPRGHVAHRGLDPQLRPDYNREHYHDVLAASTTVTVSTPYLERLLAPRYDDVKLVRNYVDLDVWSMAPAGDHIGWIGMIPWRDMDLRLLRTTVVPWLREHNRFFYHGGDVAGMGRSATEILGYDRVTTRPACGIEEYPLLWDPLRVLLIPIRNSRFNHARSYVKGLEACARGVPFIASDHAEYRELGVGRIARKPADWIRHLEELEDPDVCAAEGAANRKRAEELTIQEHWEEWADVFRSALRLA